MRSPASRSAVPSFRTAQLIPTAGDSKRTDDRGRNHMINKTRLDVLRTLFAPPERRRRHLGFGMGKKTPPSDPRIDVLVAMVLDLLMEIESLRAAHLAADSTAPDARADYPRAYRDTAYLTHNCSGPSGAIGKLLSLFYPAEAGPDRNAVGEQRTWRESLMLYRLGFSAEQIRVYKEEAKRAEFYT